MLPYSSNLRHRARRLRKNLTDSEQVLWSRLRRKQLLGIQFYRQRPIGNYIVDYFAPKAKLVVEVDGSQHMQGDHPKKDKERDAYLANLGLQVLRYNSRQVLLETGAVVEAIYCAMAERVNMKSPPSPLCQRGVRK